MPVFDNTKGKKTLVSAKAVASFFKPLKIAVSADAKPLNEALAKVDGKVKNKPSVDKSKATKADGKKPQDDK